MKRALKDPPGGIAWPGIAGALGLILLFGGFAADVSHQVSKERYAAVATYYHAADSLLHGNDPYIGGDNAYPYVYPPFYAVCFEPLARLSEPAAARVMIVIDGFFVLAALVLSSHSMLRRIGASTAVGNVAFTAMIAGVIASVPIHNELRGLETNSLLLLSFALAIFWLDRWPIAAGIALAVAINVKYLPIIALPYFCLRRRWTAAIAVLAASIAVVFLPAISLGMSRNGHYLHEAVSGLAHLAGSDTAAGSAKVNGADDLSSISITSTIARWSHAKATQLLMVAAIACAWGACLLAGYKVNRLPVLKWPEARQQQNGGFQTLVALEWAALITFALAFSPNTQNRNLVLAVIPATLAAAVVCSPVLGKWRAAASAAAFLMLVGLTLPVAAMGKPFTRAWVFNGAACWTLLATFVILGWVVMAVAASRMDDAADNKKELAR